MSKKEYDVDVIDDGTLDTVVSVEGTEYRYNWEPSMGEEMSYGDFVEWALEDAVEQYEEMMETAKHYSRLEM